jgi:hypothetical protein
MGKKTKKRKPGTPTGNAGEYFVMGELLRRGFDAQLADRNTKGYDLLVGRAEKASLRKVQVKTTRGSSWYVKQADFKNKHLKNQVAIYVLLGKDNEKPVRFFIAKNRRLKIHIPRGWGTYATLSMKAVQKYEDKWKSLPT